MIKQLVVAALLLVGVSAYAVDEISDANIQAKVFQSKGIVFVDVYAPWCSYCKKMAPMVERAEKEFAGKITFYKLDSDKNEQTRAAYSITGLPTALVFLDGKLGLAIPGAPKDYPEFENAMNQLVEAAAAYEASKQASPSPSPAQ